MTKKLRHAVRELSYAAGKPINIRGIKQISDTWRLNIQKIIEEWNQTKISPKRTFLRVNIISKYARLICRKLSHTIEGHKHRLEQMESHTMLLDKKILFH